MSNQINNGGPAFPQTTFEELRDGIGTITEPTKPGMTLRDYFAGQALQGVLANPILLELHEDYAMTAKACMNFADAMIAARNQQPEP